jgi:hypothetical protein
MMWDWTPQAVRNGSVLANVQARVGRFPYSPDTVLSSVSAFVDTPVAFTGPNQSPSTIPRYLFDTILAGEQGFDDVASGIRWPPGVLATQLCRPADNGTDCFAVPGLDEKRMMQLFLGPGGSGSSNHYHGSAVAGVASGRKLWSFLRPSDAAFTAAPAALFFEHELPALLRKGKAQLCVQEPGDLVFVPATWSHAVLNLDTTIGVAVEFETLANSSLARSE